MDEKKLAALNKILGGIFFRVLIISFSLVFFITATTLAAYTNSRHAQRTIATYEANGDRFSSNLLAKRSSWENVKTAYVTSELVQAKHRITVCNFEQTKQTQPYEIDITYSLLARLVKFDGNAVEKYVPVSAAYLTDAGYTGESYAVSLRCGDVTVNLNGSHLSDESFGRVLSGGVADEDVYHLTLGTAFAASSPNLYVEIVATPSGGFLPTLNGIFKAEQRSEGANNAWTGSFTDDTAVLPSVYDGFNYSVTGQGSGTCTIEWDASKVSINAFSLSELTAIDGATSTANSVTFPVDSDVESKYDIQFYKVNITSETWSDMNTTVVRFSFS